MSNAIALGFLVRCKVTGFIGVADNQATFMFGCDRYYVQPQVDKDGKIPDGAMIDAPQLELVEPHEQVMQAAAEPEQVIEMGQLVEDPIRGVSGTATGRAIYLNGCSRIHVTPKRASEKSPEPFWADEKQLVGRESFLGAAKVPVKPDAPQARRNGGPSLSCSKY